MLNMILNQVYLQFTFQLLVSTVPVVFNAPRKKGFLQRIIVCMIGFAVFIYFYGLLFVGHGLLRVPVGVFYYLGTAIAFFLILINCFDINKYKAIYYTVEGYAIEHMTYAAATVICFGFDLRPETIGDLCYTIIFRYTVYILFAVAAYFIFIRKYQKQEKNSEMDIRILVISAVGVFLAILFSIIYYNRPEDVVTRVICPIYGFACCGFILLIGNGILHENRMEQERKEMEHMLDIAKNQQEASKEAIDIINIKCHDLKHSLRKIEQMEGGAARSEYIKEIADAVNIYDADYHTGYDELDYVLREKALIASENGIELSCIADGKVLSFMDPVDLYTLMGNALDNAIEREKKEEAGHRFIAVKIVEKAGMSLVSVENYCSRQPEFNDGLPVTDKADKNSHGFGVRSIRFIVEKYDGEVDMSVKNNTFRMHAIF